MLDQHRVENDDSSASMVKKLKKQKRAAPVAKKDSMAQLDELGYESQGTTTKSHKKSSGLALDSILEEMQKPDKIDKKVNFEDSKQQDIQF